MCPGLGCYLLHLHWDDYVPVSMSFTDYAAVRCQHTVIPIVDGESEGKCFAEDHGMGKQLIWDFWQDLSTPGLILMSCHMPFTNAEGWEPLGHLEPLKYPANRYRVSLEVFGSIL